MWNNFKIAVFLITNIVLLASLCLLCISLTPGISIIPAHKIAFDA